MRYFFALVIAIAFSVTLNAQSYSGLIDNARASAGTGGLGTNGWAQVGTQTGNPATGALPSASYTKCGSTIPAGTTPAAIMTQLNGCSANQYVLLGPGTFNVGSAQGFLFHSGKVIRGSGADQTFIVTAAGAGNSIGCQISGVFCIQGTSAGDFVPAAGINITGGAGGAGSAISQGSNQITLASTTGISTGSMLLLDQFSDFLTSADQTAEAPDNGNFWNCNALYTAPWSAGITYVNKGQVTYAVTGHWYTVVTNSFPPAGTAPPASGSSSFWTDQGVYANATFGCAWNGPDGGNQRLLRPEAEVYLVSSVNVGTGIVTLNGSLRSPHWLLSRAPQAVLLGPPATGSGVENLSIDMTATGSNGASAIMLFDAANVWIRGVKVIKAGYAAFRAYEATHFTVQDNYDYGTTRTPGTDSDGFVGTAISDCLVQNNIFQYFQTAILVEGSDTGCVYAYNYMPKSYNGNNTGINPAVFPHAGDMYECFEGNIFNSLYLEDLHGPKLMTCVFRNFFPGWESGANEPTPVAKVSGTQAIRPATYSRYNNIIGNVLGTPGYHNAYNAGTQKSIYSFGAGNLTSSGATVPSDSVVLSSTMLWDNYDVANNSTQCNNSEVPTGIAVFPQPLPTVGCGGTALPASLYLASKPSWFGSLPFPLIGPDVTSGNVGQCSGTLNVTGHYAGVAATTNAQCTGTSLTTPAWGGHVNTNPAMNCYLNVMNGPPDGSNTSALSFNADTCYVNLNPVASFTPSPVNIGLVPQNLTSNPVSVTLQNTGTATLTNTSITLTSPLFTIQSNTCGSPATITNSIPGTGFTLAVNGTCSFQVTASPGTVGVFFTANAIFVENTSLGADFLQLTATGTGPPAPTTVMSAGKFATHTMCPVRTSMTQLCFAEDCGCWWVSQNGSPYSLFGVNSVNGKTGNVVLSVQ